MATVTVYSTWSSMEGHKIVMAGITLSSAYTADGEALNAANFGLDVFKSMVISPANGYVCEWRNSTGKVLAYTVENKTAQTNGTALMQAQASTNFTGCVFTAIVVGEGTVS